MTTQTDVWPNGARSAVLVTCHFDAELLWLRLDPSVARRPKTQSIGQYGARRGFSRVLRTLAAHEVQATWFVPAAMAKTYPDEVAAAASVGHEIACRGFDYEDVAKLDRSAQLELLHQCTEVLQGVSGQRPVGFRPFADVNAETLGALADAGFEWTSMTRGDDRPLMLDAGEERPAIVDIPYQWVMQDVPLFMFNYGPPFPAGQSRVAEYGRVARDWKLEFDAYHREGLCLVLTLDPQAIGTPGRIDILSELLDHICSQDEVWVATGREIATHWRSHPRPGQPTSEAVRIRANLARPRSEDSITRGRRASQVNTNPRRS